VDRQRTRDIILPTQVRIIREIWEDRHAYRSDWRVFYFTAQLEEKAPWAPELSRYYMENVLGREDGFLGDLWDKIKRGAKRVWDGVKRAARGLWEGVKEGAKRIWGFIRENPLLVGLPIALAIPGLGGAISSVLGSVGRIVGAGVGGLQSVLSWLNARGRDVVGPIAQAIQPGLEILQELAWSDQARNTRLFLSLLGIDIQGAVQRLNAELARVPWLGQEVQTISPAERILQDAGVIPRLGGIQIEIPPDIEARFRERHPVLSTILGCWQGIYTELAYTRHAVGGQVIPVMQSGFDTMRRGIQDLAGQVWEAVKTLWATLVSALDDIITWVKEISGRIWDGLLAVGDVIASVAEYLVDEFAKLWREIIIGIGRIPDMISRGIVTLQSAVVDTWIGIKDLIVEQ